MVVDSKCFVRVVLVVFIRMVVVAVVACRFDSFSVNVSRVSIGKASSWCKVCSSFYLGLSGR